MKGIKTNRRKCSWGALVLVVFLLGPRPAAAQEKKADSQMMADLTWLTLAGAMGAVVGGVALAGMGLASEPAANDGNDGLAMALVGTGLFSAAAMPFTAIMLTGVIDETAPEHTWPAAFLSAVATPLGVMGGAMIGWPLGSALLGNPAPDDKLSDPRLMGVVTTTVISAALVGSAASAGGAALGVGAGWAFFSDGE